MAVRLNPTAVAKPWGRQVLGPWGLGLDGDQPIGEIHHEAPETADAALLVKTLFTAERLSVQVHPDDAQARASGAVRGKDEAWVVLAAETHATIAAGLSAPCDRDNLRAAALDGRIAGMLEWHKVRAGDVMFTPAGTIHAIGAGVTIFEIQQNCHVTYRLHDYGRPRELHLDDGLSVSRAEPWVRQPMLAPLGPRALLVEGPHFVLERLTLTGMARLHPEAARPVWLAMVSGRGTVDGAAFAPGEVWWADDAAVLDGEAEVLIAYPGAQAVRELVA